jgi:hypothetical protein
MRKHRKSQARSQDNEAAPDELGRDPLEDADNQSVDELADDDQAVEAARVDGVEDAANHPERPVHTHEEYGRPDDLPPARSVDRKKAS